MQEHLLVHDIALWSENYLSALAATRHRPGGVTALGVASVKSKSHASTPRKTPIKPRGEGAAAEGAPIATHGNAP